MKLQFCAITGADDAVSIADLKRFSEEFPFVEWALLWMPERAGMPRFPTSAYIQKFKTALPHVHASLHLCGSGLLDFIAGKPQPERENFKRVQLNLTFDKAGEKVDLKELIGQVKKHPDVQFIFQYTEEWREKLLPLLKDVPNHALLFDASAGTGVNPHVWPRPIAGHVCGYAGGIGPENIAENLQRIANAVDEGYLTWVDMESRVRTNDQLDLDKVRSVLNIVSNYISGETLSPVCRV